MSAIIELEDVRKSFPVGEGELEVLKGISFDVHEGEWVAITGPSGSGKSTLLTILGCLDRLSAGRYTLAGTDVVGLDDDEETALRNREIGFIFQAFHLIPTLTVIENVQVPIFYAGVPRRDRRGLAAEALERVGLGHRLDHRPNALSGGERQRAAIARALIRRPRMLLADEPTGNLDTKTGETILELFRELHDEGRTIVMITHDRSIAQRAPRNILLRDGLIERDRRREGARFGDEVDEQEEVL